MSVKRSRITARSNTTRVKAQAINITEKALKDSADAQINLRVLTNVVADTMKDIHGGDWDIIVDHQRQAIMIYRNSAVDAPIGYACLREAI